MTNATTTARPTALAAATRLYAEHGAHAFTMVAPKGPRALSQLGEDLFRYMAAVATWVALFEIRKANAARLNNNNDGR